MVTSEKEKCLEYVRGKHGIEDFIDWFEKNQIEYKLEEFKTSLDSWIEAKSIVYMETKMPIQKSKKSS